MDEMQKYKSSCFFPRGGISLSLPKQKHAVAEILFWALVQKSKISIYLNIYLCTLLHEFE